MPRDDVLDRRSNISILLSTLSETHWEVETLYRIQKIISRKTKVWMQHNLLETQDRTQDTRFHTYTTPNMNLSMPVLLYQSRNSSNMNIIGFCHRRSKNLRSCVGKYAFLLPVRETRKNYTSLMAVRLIYSWSQELA